MSDRLPAARLTLAIETGGQRATVRRDAGHPEQYLYVDCEGGTYFLGVLEPGITRGDVRRMALGWLRRRATQPGERT